MYAFWIKENPKFGVNTVTSLAYIKQSWVSLQEPQENNLSDLEVYSEPCQASKIESFVKIVLFFVKHSILDVWQNSEYTSIICCSLSGNIEGANRIDLVAM